MNEARVWRDRVSRWVLKKTGAIYVSVNSCRINGYPGPGEPKKERPSGVLLLASRPDAGGTCQGTAACWRGAPLNDDYRDDDSCMPIFIFKPAPIPKDAFPVFWFGFLLGSYKFFRNHVSSAGRPSPAGFIFNFRFWEIRGTSLKVRMKTINMTAGSRTSGAD